MGEYAVGVATRTRIYRVCKGLFYEKGIKATSYNDICEAADINRGLIPYYFKSKNKYRYRGASRLPSTAWRRRSANGGAWMPWCSRSATS